MPNFEAFGKLLLIGGVIIAVTGIIFLIFGRIGFGRLPGDIFIQRGNFTFYFPLVTMIVISIILTLLINFLRR